MTHPAEEALDLLLALRPEDQDRSAPIDLDPARRASIEAEDAAFAALLADWTANDVGEPTFSAADILAMDAPAPAEPPTQGRGLWIAVAAAAALVLGAVGLWAVQPAPETTRTKAGTDTVASRVGLQVSVERLIDGRAVLAPARQGAAYGSEDALAFQFDLHGEAGWAALLEVTPEGDWTLIYPADGPVFIEPGPHTVSDGGEPVVYRPDAEGAGTLTYVAIVTSEEIDPALVAPGLLSAGFERADLWPRPITAVDAFTVTWESR